MNNCPHNISQSMVIKTTELIRTSQSWDAGGTNGLPDWRQNRLASSYRSQLRHRSAG